LASPSGASSADLTLSPAWGGATVQSAVVDLRAELRGIIGSRSGGVWGLTLATLDGCQGSPVALRKLALTIHGH
jgi:hypothetical protein